MSARLPNLLNDLASEMPTDTDGAAPRVLRRARVRRLATTFVASAAVVLVIVGGVSILRITSFDGVGHGPIVPGTSAPQVTPSAVPAPVGDNFAGVWPETTADALAQAQAQVDAGHEPLRLDPAQTAAMLATNLFGWRPEDVQVETTQAQDERFVDLRNRTFADDVPPIAVDLAQLGRTGPDGIWSVVKVTSPLFGNSTWITLINDADVEILGTVEPATDGAAIRFQILNGPVPEDATPTGEASLDGRQFHFTIPAGGVDLYSAVLWTQFVDPTGAALGATAFPLASLRTATTSDAAAPPGPAAAAAASTAEAIQRAAGAHDVDAIVDLIDPTVFAFDFGDARGLVPALRGDPSLFDTIAQILALPSWRNDTEGANTTYVWPSFMEPGALDDLSATERLELHGLGFSDAQIEQMRRSGGYLGPRLGIDERGTWIYFVTGGD